MREFRKRIPEDVLKSLVPLLKDLLYGTDEELVDLYLDYFRSVCPEVAKYLQKRPLDKWASAKKSHVFHRVITNNACGKQRAGAARYSMYHPRSRPHFRFTGLPR